MADLLIRNLDDRTIERLKARAKAQGRSLQSQTKLILEQAAGRTIDESLEVASAWRQRLGKRKADIAALVREDRKR